MTQKPDATHALDWISGKRFLIINNQFVSLTGSEVHCLELAEFLTACGAKVTLCGLRRDAAFCEQIRHRHPVEGRRALLMQRFDYVWSHQQTGFLLAHILCGLRTKGAVHGLLSSYLELEAAPSNLQNSGLVLLANSAETQEVAAQKAPETNVKVLRNVVPGAFADAPKLAHGPALKRLAIVSNHVPAEVEEAVNLLAAQGIETTIFGKAHRFVPIDETTLIDFDAVMTIGKTAQYCLVQGIPLFLYDHFGGPGYFAPDELERHEDANFSGRSQPDQATAGGLAMQIVEGYVDAVKNAQALAEIAPQRYLLEHQLPEVLPSPKDRREALFSVGQRFAILLRYLRQHPRTVLRTLAPHFAQRLALYRNPDMDSR